VQQQRTFTQRLGDQPEVEHLEVAQPAVDELAAAAAGATGPVTLLDQPGAQSAGDGVQRAARADHPAADDQQVELVARHVGEGGLARGRRQRSGDRHDARRPPRRRPARRRRG
jgi:hypothetical protein